MVKIDNSMVINSTLPLMEKTDIITLQKAITVYIKLIANYDSYCYIFLI